jgi:hypothetical protein
MTTGQVPASKVEIERATVAAMAAPTNGHAAAPAETQTPALRRAVRLPGIGVTEKKKKAKPGRRPKKAAGAQ